MIGYTITKKKEAVDINTIQLFNHISVNRLLSLLVGNALISLGKNFEATRIHVIKVRGLHGSFLS